MSKLIERLLKQRDAVCDLGDGLSVTLRRPPESEMPALRYRSPTEVVQAAAVGWDGFTEATFLGGAVGASDPLPFDAEVWAAWIADNTKLIGICHSKVIELVNAHLARVKEVRGN